MLFFAGCNESGTGSGAGYNPYEKYMSISDGEYADRIMLKWTPYADADSYHVYRKPESESDSEFIEITPPPGDPSALKTNQWTDHTALHHQAYSYRMRAHNEYGDTAYSASYTGSLSHEEFKNFNFYVLNPSGDLTGSVWDRTGQGGYTTQYEAPFGVSFTQDGCMFVADLGENRVIIYYNNGSLRKAFSIADTQSLDEPADVCVYDPGTGTDDIRIYVADKDNHRITRHNYDGYSDKTWGRAGCLSGTAQGQFNSPESVFVDDNGYMFVSDTGNSRIQIFNEEGVFVLEWGTSGTGSQQLNQPCGIAADSAGFFYVADSGNHRIQKFKWNSNTETLQYHGWWGKGSDGNTGWHPSGDTATGQEGTEVGEFNNPYGVAMDINGYVYVSDSMGNRIQAFSHEGDFLKEFGNDTSLAVDSYGRLNNCRGISVDPNGDVYVTGVKNKRIQKFMKTE